MSQPLPQLNGPQLAPGSLTLPAPPMPDPALLPVCPPLAPPTAPILPSSSSSSSSPGCGTPRLDQGGPAPGPAGGPAPSPTPSPPESEEDKAKKLLYCSLCKVAVNSLSQLEAHNKGNAP
ncbi:hypothetical protein JZ751_021705 [Albula glossodonta]|uniref:C2H2-type domain-containing protein n=1 Tax=Albula glossodonta TaxID=121402 RepID=A0A8T2NRM0_9TELE|nr:hypothetical protein JZ751_021705 [Albula glossodonta]